MKFIKEYNSFYENEKVTRSGRLLNQVQRNYKDIEIREINIVERSLPAVLFTDVVGSTELWNKDSVKMMKQLKKHFEIIDNISRKYNGFIVKTIGDAFMIYFNPDNKSLLNALKASKEIIEKENRFDLRIGVSFGYMIDDTYKIQDVSLRDFYGNSVNTASRMESKISPEGGIAFSILDISEDNQKNMISEITKEFNIKTVDLSEYDLKGAKTTNAYIIKVK